jgi:hypothetical protein
MHILPHRVTASKMALIPMLLECAARETALSSVGRRACPMIVLD